MDSWEADILKFYDSDERENLPLELMLYGPHLRRRNVHHRRQQRNDGFKSRLGRVGHHLKTNWQAFLFLLVLVSLSVFLLGFSNPPCSDNPCRCDEDLKDVVISLGNRVESRFEAVLDKVEELKLYINETIKDVKDGQSNITIEDVLLVIKRQLSIFDGDKLELPDYALQSTGGSIIHTRCLETFVKQSSQRSLFGIPIWFLAISPEIVFQPERNPGDCWPFVGSEGYVAIKLPRRVYPTAFSMENIPKTISPTGNIDSAPKDFSVWGLEMESDSEVLLGRYTYEDNGQPLQTFAVQATNVGAFDTVGLKIHSNHGHPLFTCLYRFRVHGTLTNQP